MQSKLKFIFACIVLIALIFCGSDGVSVTLLVSNKVSVIVIPPDISSVTLSWRYTLGAGEQLQGITVKRIGGTEKQDLVKYASSNPNDPGVVDQFKSRMNFSTSGDKINLVINNLVVSDGNGFSYQCAVVTTPFDIDSGEVELIVRDWFAASLHLPK